MIMPTTTKLTMHARAHPGEILLEIYLKPLGVTITEVASALGVTRKHVSAFIHGRAPVTPEMAVKLTATFATDDSRMTAMRMRAFYMGNRIVVLPLTSQGSRVEAQNSSAFKYPAPAWANRRGCRVRAPDRAGTDDTETFRTPCGRGNACRAAGRGSGQAGACWGGYRSAGNSRGSSRSSPSSRRR